MRFSLLCASAALAASLALSGCSSSSGSSTIPGNGSQPVASSGTRQHFIPVQANKIRPDDGNYGSYTCPAGGSQTYFYCYYIQQNSTFSQGWCESTQNNCNYLEYGQQWHWRKTHVTSLATGRSTHNVVDVGWNPVKGNPSTQEISVTQNATVNAYAVGYVVDLEACHHGSCDGAGGQYPVGIVVLPPAGSGSGSGSGSGAPIR